MVAPYRTPALVEPSPDLPPIPAPCACSGPCARCSVVCVHAPCPCCSAPRGPRRARGLFRAGGLWTKAVTVASLLLLSGATASVMALAWKVTTTPDAPTAAGAHKSHPSVPTVTSPEPAAIFVATPPAPSWPSPRWQSTLSRPPEPARTQDAVSRPPGARPSFDLGSLGRPTHAPDELWTRAAKLAAAGARIVLTETSLAHQSASDLEEAFGPAARIVQNDDFPGVRVVRLPAGSIARAAGLQDGDVVTAVNGHALSSPAALLDAYTSVRQSRTAVIELHRGGHPVVLRIRIRP